MKKIRLKILPKTFIGALSLIVGIIVIAFLLIGVLTPLFYRGYKEETLNKDLNDLTLSSASKNTVDIQKRIEAFASGNEYGVSLTDQNGEVIFAREVIITMQQTYFIEKSADDSQFSKTMEVTNNVIDGERTFTDSNGRTLTLYLYSSMQPIDEIGVVLLRVLPYVLLISIGLGVAVSFLYAKTITAPVKAISQATFKMMTLDKDAGCVVETSDEIGELAENINELYGRLLSTINDLQNKIENVAAADKEKIDFMLAVSHELKTPLTAVKGMLEGMIYNVGVYKDRDEYLTRCGENIDALSALVNEILGASKLELSPSPEDFVDTNIRELVKSTAATYKMIALSKQITVNIDIDVGKHIALPAGLFSKALSNIISNAVRYTDESGAVGIYIESGSLVIENTCNPLTPGEIHRAFEPFYSGGKDGGHGLGLYLTERILKVCGLSFEFVPFDKGMRFVIYME